MNALIFGVLLVSMSIISSAPIQPRDEPTTTFLPELVFVTEQADLVNGLTSTVLNTVQTEATPIDSAITTVATEIASVTVVPQSNVTVITNASSIPLSSVSLPVDQPSHLSLDSEANHQITVNKQNDVIAFGEQLSLGITNTLIRPLVFFNNKVSEAASTLPGVMAANGAVLGSAIATPIQLGTLAANNLAAGITGTLVSIPISLVSGGTAQLIGLVESGTQLYQGTVNQLTAAVQQSLPDLAQPLAVVNGAKSVVGGIALGTLANGVQRLGQGVELLGTSLSSTGTGVVNAGSALSGWTAPNVTAAANNTTSSPLTSTTVGANSTNLHHN